MKKATTRETGLRGAIVLKEVMGKLTEEFNRLIDKCLDEYNNGELTKTFMESYIKKCSVSLEKAKQGIKEAERLKESFLNQRKYKKKKEENNGRGNKN